MSTIVLLGAGASIPARVPGAYKLTRAVYSLMSGAKGSISRSLLSGELYFRPEVVDLVKYVHKILSKKAKNYEIDVELFGAAIDDFVSLPTDQIEPFVQSFLPQLDDWRITASDAPRLVRSAVRQQTWLAASSGKRTRYLSWILDLVEKSEKPTIATLNYDNTIELCASAESRYSYGFKSGWRTHMPIRFPRDRIALIKLHGSSNWSLGEFMPIGIKNAHLGKWSRFEMRVFAQAELDLYTKMRLPLFPALLFGRGIKMRYSGPFISLYDHFRKRLHLHDRMVVVGYSFRDGHINDDISNWLDVDPSRRLIIVSPNAANDIDSFRQKLNVPNARIIPIAQSASDPQVSGLVDNALA